MVHEKNKSTTFNYTLININILICTIKPKRLAFTMSSKPRLATSSLMLQEARLNKLKECVQKQKYYLHKLNIIKTISVLDKLSNTQSEKSIENIYK